VKAEVCVDAGQDQAHQERHPHQREQITAHGSPKRPPRVALRDESSPVDYRKACATAFTL
jgi:hypothetical protein